MNKYTSKEIFLTSAFICSIVSNIVTFSISKFYEIEVDFICISLACIFIILRDVLMENKILWNNVFVSFLACICVVASIFIGILIKEITS